MSERISELTNCRIAMAAKGKENLTEIYLLKKTRRKCWNTSTYHVSLTNKHFTKIKSKSSNFLTLKRNEYNELYNQHGNYSLN